MDTAVRLLKSQKSDLCKTTKQGRTLLHLAAATTNGDILPFLHGSYIVSLVNKPDENLCTPLHDAHFRIIDALVVHFTFNTKRWNH